MHKTWIGRSLFCAGLSLAACGDENMGGEGDDEVVDPSTQTGVGRWGGDCKDGDTRCIDTYGAPLCPVNTGYGGDDLALCEPAGVTDGLLLHYGPRNYDDPAEVAKYLLVGNGEDENCVYVRSTNTEPVYVNRYHGRMRPLSHHLIVTVVDEWPQGVPEGEPVSCNQAEALGSTWLLGSQDPQIDLEVEGATPGSVAAQPGDPEYGLGQKIMPNSVLRLDLHYVNTTEQEILREAWVYLKAVPKEEVVTEVDMITWFQFNISVPPMSSGVKTARGRCRVPETRNIGLMTGHFHENGTRFSVWHEPAGGEPILVYDTKDWDVPGNAFYSARITNPPPDGSGIWGATSGYLTVNPGDYVSFECEYSNPTNVQVRLGELGEDQMCNVFGFYYPTNGSPWSCICYGELCL